MLDTVSSKISSPLICANLRNEFSIKSDDDCGYVAGDIVKLLSERVEERAREVVKLVKVKAIWSVYKGLRAARPAESGCCRVEIAANTRW